VKYSIHFCLENYTVVDEQQYYFYARPANGIFILLVVLQELLIMM
jgi:hypothetical protein